MSPGTGKTKGTVSLAMSLCLHPSVSTIVTKALRIIGPSFSMIAKLNFVKNVIGLGSVDELTVWMDPGQSSFNYPGSRLLPFCGLVSDEMFKPANLEYYGHEERKRVQPDHRLPQHHPSFVRTYSTNGHPGKMSKEWCVLPRNSKSGSFSARGDSGFAVIDGIGRVSGIITGVRRRRGCQRLHVSDSY